MRRSAGRRPAGLTAGLSLLLLAPRIAAAHSLVPGIGGFYAGAFTLVAGPVDALVWLSIAVLAGLHAERAAGWTAEAFAGGLLAGLFLVRLLHLDAWPDLADAAILLATGAAIAFGRRMPDRALQVYALLVGILRGCHYGADTATRSDIAPIAAGLALTGYVLVAASLAAVLCFRGAAAGPRGGGWRIVALRAVGSWIGAIGAMWGGFALR